MRSSKLVRSGVQKSIVRLLFVLIAIVGFNGMIRAQNITDEAVKEKWQQKKEEMRQKFEERKQSWQNKKAGLTFENDSGAGKGHEDGLPGTRVGHSDDMPGKRRGHRKFSSNRSEKWQNKENCNDQFFSRRRRRFDNDNNPPGNRGGEGTNWENLPGRKGGPGMSPDRMRRFGNNKGECGNKNQPKRFRRKFMKNDSENSENNGSNGSNGLHIGNRKNGVGRGIKNYSGRTRPNKGKKNK